MKNRKNPWCPLCQCALVAIGTAYLCSEHGAFNVMDFEPEMSALATADLYNPHGWDTGVETPTPLPVAAALVGSGGAVGFEPMQHDAWPWFDESDTSVMEMSQRMNAQRGAFLLVTNGAHRQAMT